jgi:anti-anti-sigma factor
MGLKVGNEIEGNVVVLEPRGSLDASSVDQLTAVIKDTAAKEGTYRLVMTMDYLEFISSAGWSVLVEASRDLKEKNGDLRLSDMKQTAQRIFRLMGLEACLKLYPSREEAVKSYAE